MIEINGKTIHPPKSWNDIEPKMLYMLFTVLSGDFNNFLKPEEVVWATRIGAMRLICGLSDQFVKEWRNIRMREHGDADGLKIFHAELHEVTKAATGFMFAEKEDEEGNTQVEIIHGLTRCPYPELDMGNGVTWYAPADELGNLTIYELGSAFTLFEAYIKTENNDLADKLLGLIFRPSKPATEHNLRSNYEGDRRLPYAKHETTVDDRAEKFKTIPGFCKQLLLFWFSSCRQVILNNYPTVFTGGDGKADEFGWGGLLLSIAENPANIDQVAAQPFNNILTHLAMLEKQRKEAKLKSLQNR